MAGPARDTSDAVESVAQDGFPPCAYRRESLSVEYAIYLSCADDGQGGDITRGGAPLLSFDDWLAR